MKTLTKTLKIFFNFVLVEKTKSNEFETNEAQIATMYRNRRTRFATCVEPGKEYILRPPNSAVSIQLPQMTIRSVFIGCVHLDALDFLKILTDRECLIAPIVGLHQYGPNKSTSEAAFKLQIPHCLNPAAVAAASEGQKILTIRRIDTETNEVLDVQMKSKSTEGNRPFQFVTDESDIKPYYSIDDTYIVVHTPTLSAYLCTSCDKVCNGEQNVFICGGIKSNPRHWVVEIRPYICNLLSGIEDYDQVCIFFLFLINLFIYYYIFGNRFLGNLKFRPHGSHCD